MAGPEPLVHPLYTGHGACDASSRERWLSSRDNGHGEMPPALCLFHADCVLFGHFLKPDVCFTLCPLCRSVRSPWMWAASGAGTPMQCTPVDVEQLEQEAKQAADTVEPSDDEPTPLGQAPPPPRNPVEKPTQASQPTLFTPSEA